MSKPGGKNPSPKTPSKALVGSGSKGRQSGKVAGLPGAYGTAPTDPSQSGNPGEVAQRTNVAGQGKMLHNQLKKNRSTGTGSLGSVKAAPKGKSKAGRRSPRG